MSVRGWVGNVLKAAGNAVSGGGALAVAGASASGRSARRTKQIVQTFLEAYSTQPWLRAIVSKRARGLAAVQWTAHAVKGKSGKHILTDIAKCKDFEYRRKQLTILRKQGRVDDLEDHPIVAFLQKPSAVFPGAAVRALDSVYYDLVGESFNVIDVGKVEGSKLGALPVSMWPIPAHWVDKVPMEQGGDGANFKLMVGGKPILVPMGLMLWDKDIDPANPYGRGTGQAGTLSDELDALENASELVNYEFYNKGRPDMLVSLIGMSKKDLLEYAAHWKQELQGGVGKMFKTHFTNVDQKATVIGMDFQSLQLAELMRNMRDYIRQCYGTPPEILGIIENSNRATIESADYLFMKHTVQPRADDKREHYQMHLVPFYDDRLILDFKPLVSEDKEFSLAVSRSVPFARTVDEWREAMGEEPLGPEGGGDMFPVDSSTIRLVRSLKDLEKEDVPPALAGGAMPPALPEAKPEGKQPPQAPEEPTSPEKKPPNPITQEAKALAFDLIAKLGPFVVPE